MGLIKAVLFDPITTLFGSGYARLGSRKKYKKASAFILVFEIWTIS